MKKTLALVIAMVMYLGKCVERATSDELFANPRHPYTKALLSAMEGGRENVLLRYDPELIIRPSGEMRTSNFLLWQASYAELYFPEVLWPDFTEEEFDRAMEEYARRDRRFGLVK